MPFNGRDNPNLKRPAPSSGFADFPRVGNHASMSDSNAPPGPRVMKPSVHNSTFSLAANPNATYPLFCGAFSNGYQLGYKEGMPLFINKQHTKDSRTTITGRHRSHNILCSIPLLNFYLTIGSSDEQFVQRFVKRYQLNEALIPRYPSDEELEKRLKKSWTNQTTATKEEKARMRDVMFIESFNEKYEYMGIILSDMDVSSKYQKLFNLNVRGRSRVFNLWTTRMNGRYERKMARDRVQKGDHLFLVLRKEPVDETTYMQPDGASMPIIPPANQSNQVWQIRAERTTHGKAPFPERIDGSMFCEPKLHIEVGKVSNAISKKPDEHFQRRAFRSHDQMVALPMVEVFLHTGQL